ncbi:MAG: Gfo/Idh/MocA family oxidoreductase [Rhodoglobus sp.]
MGGPLRFGIVGVGKISEQYFASLGRLPGIRLVAVADLDAERSAQVAAEHGVESLTVDALIAHPDIDAILNLTIPIAHVDIATRALAAGKHVFGEKPLGLTVAEAGPMLALAESAGLRVGSAPDTVLGTGIQTARQLLDSGAIGDPVGASASWVSSGHEQWHPAPQFYYQPGGGPLFDMGPYYLTALVELLGPVVRVSATTRRSTRERAIEVGARAGTPIAVEVDTHVTALLEHAAGPSSTIQVSFDVWTSRHSPIELYGSSGTMAVPDPNHFDDPVSLWTPAAPEWTEVAPTAGYLQAARGYGLADMAQAIATDRPHRASGLMAMHVLDIMESILLAGAEHRVVELVTTAEQSAPIELGSTPESW